MKADLHCHSQYSYDSIAKIEEIIKEAETKGLDAVAITDHDNARAWKEIKKTDFPIILGEEIKTNKGDVLGLFLKQEINGRQKNPRWVMEEIKKQEGIVIIPHPFHFLEGFQDNLENYLDLIDGLEVLNGRLPFSFFDKKAYNFAQKHNLAMIGGTDAHCSKAIGDVYTESEAKTLEELKQTIKDKKTKARGKKSNIIYALCPFLAKIKRLLLEKRN